MGKQHEAKSKNHKPSDEARRRWFSGVISPSSCGGVGQVRRKMRSGELPGGAHLLQDGGGRARRVRAGKREGIDLPKLWREETDYCGTEGACGIRRDGMFGASRLSLHCGSDRNVAGQKDIERADERVEG